MFDNKELRKLFGH